MKTNTENTIVGILGAGRQAAETSEYLLESGCKVAFFFVQSEYFDSENLLQKIAPVITEKDNLTEFEDLPVISAVGSPSLKKILIKLWPYSNYTSFIHKTAWVSQTAKIGKDVTVPPMAVINTEAEIADHVLLNIGVTLSHDVKIGEYCTISPGVHIAGKSIVGSGSFLGIGANVIDSVTIGNGAIVAAGALVNGEIETQTMVAGVPAKKMKELNAWY